jgi:hypothetical protein
MDGWCMERGMRVELASAGTVHTHHLACFLSSVHFQRHWQVPCCWASLTALFPCLSLMDYCSFEKQSQSQCSGAWLACKTVALGVGWLTACFYWHAASLSCNAAQPCCMLCSSDVAVGGLLWHTAPAHSDTWRFDWSMSAYPPHPFIKCTQFFLSLLS